MCKVSVVVTQITELSFSIIVASLVALMFVLDIGLLIG